MSCTKEYPHRVIILRRSLFCLAFPLAILAALLLDAFPVSAATVVNTTFPVAVNIQVNPCTTPNDVIDLHGQIHIVITSTADNAGGYQMIDHLDSQFTGISLLTGIKYVNSEGQDDSWYARPPFPVVHTHTYNFELVSQSGTPNYILHVTMHETVNANGVPTAAVDNLSIGCQG